MLFSQYNPFIQQTKCNRQYRFIDRFMRQDIFNLHEKIIPISESEAHVPLWGAKMKLQSTVASEEPLNLTSRNVVWSGRCHDATQSDIKSAAAAAPRTDSSRALPWRRVDCRETAERGGETVRLVLLTCWIASSVDNWRSNRVEGYIDRGGSVRG